MDKRDTPIDLQFRRALLRNLASQEQAARTEADLTEQVQIVWNIEHFIERHCAGGKQRRITPSTPDDAA